ISFSIASSIIRVLLPRKLNNLGALGRLGLTDRLVEPNLISERIHDGKSTVTPPLIRKRGGGFDSLLLHLIVVGVHIGYLQIDFDWTLRGGRARALHPFLRPHEHHFDPSERYGTEIKLPIFA